MARFKRVYIEITNMCNLSCDFCPKTKRKMRFLEVDEFVHILNQIKPFTKYIYFHLMGEPFLNPNLQQFLEISKKEGFYVNITTNGTLINKVKDVLIKSDSIRQINYSLHSFEANNEEIDFNTYLNNILDFIDSCEGKFINALRLWNLDDDKIKGKNKKNNDVFEIMEKHFKLDYNLRGKIFKDKKVKLKDKIYLNTAKKFEWPDINRDIINCEGFCHGLRDQVGVLVDGTVVPCCLDSEGNIPLGNIYNKPFEQIINSDRATKIYTGFSERKVVEDLCKRCGYRKIF